MRIFLYIIFICSGSFTPAETPGKIILLGDSLTEGYGVARDQAYPALIQKMFEKEGRNLMIVNSGISGSTSASAPARMRWVIKQKPILVVLALGANDGLRGLKIAEIRKNLSDAIEIAKKEKIKVILAGMRLPPNYGATYTAQFAAVFPEVAKKENVPLIPFLLEGVGGQPDLNQSDQIHPNEKGHKIVAETVSRAIRRELK